MCGLPAHLEEVVKVHLQLGDFSFELDQPLLNPSVAP
jgi:hypothetical protein